VAISCHIDYVILTAKLQHFMTVQKSLEFTLALTCLCFLIFSADNANAWQMKQGPLMTRWAALVDTNAPLPEYPRPQMVRTNWMNLNGIWQFQPGATNDPVPVGQTLSNQILVPYPMESAISGVMQYYEFSWYRRTFTVPPAWNGKRIILHLDAVNWQATVYVNGQKAGVHRGGYDPISYDITPYLNGATNELIVNVYSPEDNGGEPRGKQTLYPGGIMYTSSSGIWQPVWLEPVDSSGISSLHIVPDVDNAQVRLTVNCYATNGVTVAATVLSNGVAVNTETGNPRIEMDIPVPNPNLWSPDNPFLYDLQVSTIHNGVTNDRVASYFGMRKISIQTANGVPQIYLNNRPYFEMGPLDQGFWPDGIYTAPTDDALKYDLQIEKALGFNAVRKHIKVERQRWYYWADKLGLLVWQDMPSCNSYTGNPNPPAVDPSDFIAELTAMVTNHWNHPCIVMWDLFNEGQGEAGSGNGVGQTNTAYLANLAKTLDPSRLVNEASGGSYFGVGDVFDEHSYPDPGDPFSSTQAPADGEFGGIAWHVNGHLWNPAQAGTSYLLASSLDDFASLYDGYIDEAINYKTPANGGLNAAIYTQITDVENECNGLMTYDRLVKPDMDRIYMSNLKAITGHLNVTPVVPTSQIVPQSWKYTTNTPPANWYATNFDDSGWSTGLAGFGTPDPNVTPNTTWNTPGYIYLRRAFNPGPLTPRQIKEMGFTLYHDEDAAIYINGVFAGSASGYSTAYVSLPMTPQAQAAIIPNGANLLAVSCYQSTGGQFIDVGISDQLLVANTFTIPTDESGHWPLDATNGTVAVDATGDGYNGTVYGATWDPNGKVNGCLTFNGVNNYVQIPNPVSNDFSIVFRVKTAQTAGTGQWYNGAGLVDGDYPGVANDFGAALVGGKFAFGVGNPDTTILSTTPINDGNWHLCVATRAQCTGAINLYVDGKLEATGAGGTNTLNASSSLVFGRIASGGNYFDGSLDEVEIFNRALGNNEIYALYNNGAFPQTTPTILLTPASQTLDVGGTASFSAQAIGGNLSYQWDFNGTPMPGATNNTFLLTNVTLSAAGSYSIVVSNAAGIASNLVTLTVQQPALTLLHRYSFVSDASDSVGGANGTLMPPNGGAAATINHGLILPGNTHGGYGYSGYVSLPAGLLTTTTDLTVECWVTQNQGNTWAEIWDFGNNGSQNFALIPDPDNNNNNMEVAFTSPAGEIDMPSAVSFPNGSEQYICVTYNNSSLTGNLYTNGVLVATQTFPNNTYTPGNIGGTGGTTNNTLGNDVYGDDQFSGAIHELRIWNGIVSPLYLAVSTVAGPDVVATNLIPLSLTVTITNSSMGAGFTQQALAVGNFSAASGIPVTSFVTNWSSSNPGVLTVGSSGLITAVNPGSATIGAILNGVTGISSSITVTSSPPVIAQQPMASETLLAGATLNASVSNIGDPPFVYRWYFNDGTSPISTATTPALMISNLQPANAGGYTCLVSNQYGMALSSALILTVVSPNQYQQSLLSLNPIAYWPLNETSGTIAHDLVGNYNGTYVGGCALAQSGPANSIFGSPSRSVLFDGTSGYVDIPEGPFNITGPITMVAWVKVLSVPSFAGLFGHGDASWRMSINSSGEPGASDGGALDATSSTCILDGNWHMIAYTYTGIPGANNGLLYVDGVLAANQNVTTSPPGDELDVWIGGSPDYGTARLINAQIANAAIFAQALTAAQVRDLNSGIYAGSVKLDVTRAGSEIILTWPAGILLQAPTLLGPWSTNSAAVSPYTVSLTAGNQFFRVLVNP
jgi:Concanavalin A-like lectin/glucanases superfamily/Glycosyl hydrolases family 2, sugar binding domain/Glycosyl hydrolases family 2/Glycosyl hydrolases family 2, TIM barrel domain/Immunoglobulin domain